MPDSPNLGFFRLGTLRYAFADGFLIKRPEHLPSYGPTPGDSILDKRVIPFVPINPYKGVHDIVAGIQSSLRYARYSRFWLSCDLHENKEVGSQTPYVKIWQDDIGRCQTEHTVWLDVSAAEPLGRKAYIRNLILVTSITQPKHGITRHFDDQGVVSSLNS
jgi:hypothetical protein